MVKLLRLSFLPTSVDLALLVLRVWFGLALVSLHGWSKLTGFAERSQRFADPFGIGSTASLVLVVFAEVVCSVLLVVGLFTRFAAVTCAITMGTAFYFAHGGRLTGQGNGELPFIFLGGFVALFLAGAGRFSLDGRGGSKK
jgi:putative oxidoreductase